MAKSTRLAKWALKVASGECLLEGRANGGGIVFARALWSSLLIFAAAVWIKELLDPESTCAFSWEALRVAVGSNLNWFGAIIAAMYIALYARFASQWTYLAGVYNQIMNSRAEVTNLSPEQERVYAAWWAGFVEDAEEVHLALKPMYASVISGLLGDPSVRDAYADTTVNGQRRLEQLEERLQGLLGEEMFERLKSRGMPERLDPCPAGTVEPENNCRLRAPHNRSQG
jgi:hypothetical protein